MKRAVAQLEKYLDKIEGYTKGTVVLATVFGDVHDIGKSLVNTILTNNGYTVVDLGKQVPIQTIVDAAAGARRDRDRPVGAARLDLQADAGVHRGAAGQGPLLPRADRRRGDQPRVRLPRAVPRRQRLRGASTSRACSTARTPSRASSVMDQLVDDDARAALVREAARRRDASSAPRARRPRRSSNLADDSVRSAARTDVPIPTPPFWGVQEIPVDLDEVYRHLDTHVLFKLHWGGRGVKGEEWQTLLREDFRPRLERMWREQTYLHPRALLGFFPCYALGNDIVVLDPEDRTTRADALRVPAPAEGRAHLPRGLLPPGARPDGAPAGQPQRARRDRGAGRDGRLRGHRADGEARGRRRVRRAAVRARPRRCRPPRVSRSGCTSEVRRMLGIPLTQGRRYSWGYPAVPEQCEHLKVEKLLDLGADRHDDHRRLRARARAVDARAGRPPPAGDLLRHAPGPTAAARARPTT